MDNAPDTRASLILRLRDGRDEESWAEFVQIYSPLIY
jgi:RNA polymerase sigma-70 factor (ECF subfamily)